MKFLNPQLTYLLTQRETRENLSALSKYLVFLTGTIVVYSILFHLLMHLEGQSHSWVHGLLLDADRDEQRWASATSPSRATSGVPSACWCWSRASCCC